jgi:hypothetical protein
MDKYITINPVKENSKFIGNPTLVRSLKQIVESNETVCLYGDSGVGKTFLVHHVLHGLKRVDYTTKDDELVERLQNSDTHVVIDDIELDKQLIEHIKEGGKLSKGSLVIILRSVSRVDFCNCLHFERPDVGTMVAIGAKQFPNVSKSRLESLAKLANGNIRNFLYSVDFPDDRDLFKTPKDFLIDLACVNGTENPSNHLCESICEHGYTWDVIHENYLDVPDVDFVSIAENLSQSENIDTLIYNGNWDLLPLFSMTSILIPSILLQHKLKRETLRPGSSWTKYGNYRMRMIKYRSMTRRTTNCLDHDALCVIRSYPPDAALAIMKSYQFQTQDVDIMNHLSFGVKMKAREIQNLKKRLCTA